MITNKDRYMSIYNDLRKLNKGKCARFPISKQTTISSYVSRLNKELSFEGKELSYDDTTEKGTIIVKRIK